MLCWERPEGGGGGGAVFRFGRLPRLLWDGVKTTGKKGKKKVVDDDPWKDLEKKRRAEQRTRKGEGLGLNAKDQIQAPPELGPLKLNPFKQKV